MHSSSTASFDVVADSLFSTDSALASTAFAPSVHLPAPYTHTKPDEPKPPDIIHSKSNAGVPGSSAVTNVLVVKDDLKVLGHEQKPFDEDGDLDVPRHLLDFFDTVVDQGNLDDDEQDELAAILRTYALMSQTH